MKTGIISDIHGNLEAFTAVLERLDNIGVDRLFCLGDVVGYGADPEACLSLAAERCDVILMGNHDQAVAGAGDMNHFNQEAAAAAHWSAEQLSAEWREYLSSLPFRHEVEGAVYVHSTPHKPELWRYISSSRDAEHVFRNFRERVVFVGHSHVAGMFRHDGEKYEKEVEIEEAKHYIINVGSVGQPRDRNPDAAFAVYDEDKGRILMERAPYDVETAAGKIKEAGLPEFLARRLALGV